MGLTPDVPDIDLPEAPDPQQAAVPQPEAPPARPSAADEDTRVRELRQRLRRRRSARGLERSRMVRPRATPEQLGVETEATPTLG